MLLIKGVDPVGVCSVGLLLLGSVLCHRLGQGCDLKKDFSPGSLGLLKGLLDSLEAVPEFCELVGHLRKSNLSVFSFR